MTVGELKSILNTYSLDTEIRFNGSGEGHSYHSDKNSRVIKIEATANLVEGKVESIHSDTKDSLEIIVNYTLTDTKIQTEFQG